MKKTALQQAIEKLESLKNEAKSKHLATIGKFPDSAMTHSGMSMSYGIAIDVLQSLRPTEKEHEKQIAQEAWAACLDYVTTPGLPNFEQYFTNTYGN